MSHDESGEGDDTPVEDQAAEESGPAYPPLPPQVEVAGDIVFQEHVFGHAMPVKLLHSATSLLQRWMDAFTDGT